MSGPSVWSRSLLLSLSLAVAAPEAAAFPGVYLSKDGAKRVVKATHIVMMHRGDASVVTVMPDYEGPSTPYAVVMPVPADVTLDRVRVVKREFVARVEEMTAPRFHEFYEQDPCDPGPPQQEWERDLRVKTTGFLGGNQEFGGGEGAKKVPRELTLSLDTKFKEAESEYTFTLIGKPTASDDAGDDAKKTKGGKASSAEAGDSAAETYPDLASFAAAKGYQVPEPVAAALAPYLARGMLLLVGEVDSSKVELISAERGQLAGIRYWSSQPVTSFPLTLGRFNAEGKQDDFYYVLHPEHRWEPKNYGYVFPPTNLDLVPIVKTAKGKDRYVKERVSEVYNALFDRVVAKDPGKLVYEYAWHSKGCGEPCPNEPLLINELLTLGGDVLELETVPEAERQPPPADETEEEAKAFEAELKEMKPGERTPARKAREADRRELARRKALLERQQYVVSRFHHRFDAADAKKDLEIGPAKDHIEGGMGVPKGQQREVPPSPAVVKQPERTSRFQIRFNHFFPWEGMMQCEQPERWRWGKRWRHKRVWNKLWMGTDLAHKRRDEIDLAQVIRTDLPALGLAVASAQPAAGTPESGATAAEPSERKACGCRAAGGDPRSAPLGVLAATVIGAAGLRRRRRR